jgi:glutamate-1-semialdehyde 2,1-aminomutase
MNIDKKKLFAQLSERYEQTHKKSGELFRKASLHQVRGGSHNLRLFAPFPFYDIQGSGSKITDIDGNTYIDFWQGHFGNILGHNPPAVIDALKEYFQNGQGLATGFPGCSQNELAELIHRQTGIDKIRFTTSGALATMYAIMLARAHTGRSLVMKIGGGWHGAQPFALKGVSSYDNGLEQSESAGLSHDLDSDIIIARFNNIEDLNEKFKTHGERISCFIIEPFIGAGGFIFARKDYLEKARELTARYGAVLIFDEVVSGFRFHPGGVQNLYGIEPDLSVFGKAIGGGMPVSAVGGKEEIMELCSPDAPPGRKVKFEGGTFSAHPSAMLAGTAFIKYLVQNEHDIYPRIGKLGKKVRTEIEAIFSRYGIRVKCTGGDETIAPNSSVVGVHFVNEGIDRVLYPEEVWNPGICDFEMREKIFRLAMLEEGFNIFHGYGAISAAHSGEEIQASLDAMERIAKRWAPMLGRQ